MAKQIPQTFEEAVTTLLRQLRPKQRESLRSIAGPDLSESTWQLAAWIRNEFGLWGGASLLLHQPMSVTGDEDKDQAAGFDHPHPDDISVAIIRAAWERLQQEAVEPDAAPDRR